MTIKKFLQKKYHAYPHLGVGDIDLLLALAIHRRPDYLYKNPDKNLNQANLLAFRKLLLRRQRGWSIASLQKYAYFFGLKFIVNSATLIPRPDSEVLVQTALDYLKENKIKQPNIVDIGTGSGCLLLSLAKNYTKPAKYLGTDISTKALLAARTNARKLGLKNQVKFLKSNLFKNIPPNKYDLVLANLPYLTKTQLKEPSIKKEPISALYGGPTGLDYYKKLLQQVPKYLNKKYLILLEIDPDQKNQISSLIKNLLPDSQLDFINDLANRTRLAKIYN